MGVYDSFNAKCAKCGTEIEVQSKAFDSYCACINVGDTVFLSEAPDSFRLEDRHSCYKCGYVNTIVVNNRIFEGFE